MPSGAPTHKPTDDQRHMVEAMQSYGIPQYEIAKVIGIDDKTLRKHYRSEIDKGAPLANAKVGRFLFNAASGDALSDESLKASYADCVRAAIFWGKTRMGMSEKTELDLKSSDGSMSPTRIEIVAGDNGED